MPKRRLIVEVEGMEDLPPLPTNNDEKTNRRATVAFRLADRTRTIDQVKRLYAVIMGLAIGTCLTSSAQAIKATSFDASVFWIIASQSISLVSLMLLFFLGAERSLDTRYLDRSRLDSPKWIVLFYDLCALGVTAGIFVILADLIPGKDDVFAKSGTLQPLAFFVDQQKLFLYVLLVLYAIDVFMLALQFGIVYFDRFLSQDVKSRTLQALRWWIISNVACSLLLSPLIGSLNWLPSMPSPDLWAPYNTGHTMLRISFASACLLVLHVVRFFADFILAYPFYYPQKRLPNSDDLYLQEP